MQNFQVPQFIEIEDKIFGPLSFKQFIYLAGGIGLAFIFYTLNIPWVIKGIPILASLGLGLALTFYRINDRPFIYAVQSALKFALNSKLYLWKKSAPGLKKASAPAAKVADIAQIPRPSSSRLKDLSWSLDVQENIK